MTPDAPSQRREVYLGDVLCAACRRWKAVCACVLLAGLLGAGAAWLAGAPYLALARLRVVTGAPHSVRDVLDRVHAALSDSPVASRLAAGSAGLAARSWGLAWGRAWSRLRQMTGLAAAERAPGVADLAKSVAESTVLRALPGCGDFDVGVLARDPESAAALANRVAEELIELSRQWSPPPAVHDAAERPDTGALALRRAQLELLVRELAAYQAARRTGADVQAPFVAGDALLEKLRSDLADVRQRLHLLESRLGPKHPEIAEARRLEAWVLGQIDSEVAQLLRVFRDEARLLSAPPAPPPAADASRSVASVLAPEPALEVVARAAAPGTMHYGRPVGTIVWFVAAGLALGIGAALVLERGRLATRPRQQMPTEPPHLQRKG